MAKKVLLIDENNHLSRNFIAAMERDALEVTEVNQWASLQSSIESGEFDLLVFSSLAKTKNWTLCEKVLRQYSEFPIIFILPNDCELEAFIIEDEVHKIVRPLTDRTYFLETLSEVSKIGHLYKRLRVAESKSGQSEQEKLGLQAAVFDSFDVGLMLDEMLKYFGQRIPCENLYWVRWDDVGHIVEADEEALKLEADAKYMRTPRLRTYEDTPATEVFEILRKTLKGRNIEEFGQCRALVAEAKQGKLVLIPVKAKSQGQLLGCLMIDRLDVEDTNELVDQIGSSLEIMSKYLDFGYAYWDAKNLSYIDDLTQLYNQRYLPQVLDQEISRARRMGSGFSVLFLDADHFKLVNDTHGHWVGSKLLIELGHVLKSSTRSCDYAFRYGGDEYIVVLVDTTSENARRVAERIRKTVEETSFLVDGSKVNLTVSIGLASYPDHSLTKEQLIKMADQAMYYGKNKSRNIVYVAS